MLFAESSPVPAGSRILLGTSEDNDQVMLGAGVLNSIPDSSCFTDPPLGPVNFGGSVRDFGPGVELFFGFHAPDKKGKHRQYEFRDQRQLFLPVAEDGIGRFMGDGGSV